MAATRLVGSQISFFGTYFRASRSALMRAFSSSDFSSPPPPPPSGAVAVVEDDDDDDEDQSRDDSRPECLSVGEVTFSFEIRRPFDQGDGRSKPESWRHALCHSWFMLHTLSYYTTHMSGGDWPNLG